MMAMCLCHASHADDGALNFIDVLGGLTAVLLIVTIGLVHHVIKPSTRERQLEALHSWRYDGHERYEGGDTRRSVNGERDQFEWRGGYSDDS